MFSRMKTILSTKNSSDDLDRLADAIRNADSIIIGAGAGLSTSAGFTYSGERFDKTFSDFKKKYGFEDMYSGGFYVMELPAEVSWAFWSRNIYVNRYMDPPKPVYQNLYELVKDKDYFVITTNVDHCFQKAGFDKHRLFYTQGDYGLFQCSKPCHNKTYDNEETVRKMLVAQGFRFAENGELYVPEGTDLKMEVPTELVPKCPVCGEPMSMNLRADDSFVQDEGWQQVAQRYQDHLRTRKGKILFLELGVGYNTPVIIKYPFWQMTANNPEAIYACINYNEASCPKEIEKRSICINGDIGEVLNNVALKLKD